MDAPGADSKHCVGRAFHAVRFLHSVQIKKRRADYSNTAQKRRRHSHGPCLRGVAPTVPPADASDLYEFRTIQRISDPGTRLPASQLNAVALRSANKLEVKVRI